MNLERLPEKLPAFVVLVLGIGFAMFVGTLTGSGNTGRIVMLAAGLAVVVGVLTLRTKIWLLIPFAWWLGGRIQILPLPFTVRDLAVMTVFVVFLGFIALKLVKRRPPVGYLDVLLLINLIWLVCVFVRNPAGTTAMNFANVGGKPYFDITIAFLAFLVLSRVTLSARDAVTLPIVVLAGGMVNVILGAVTYLLPNTVPFLSKVYSDIATESYLAQDAKKEAYQSGRQLYLTYLGRPLTLALVSYFRPLTLINPLYPWRTLWFGIGILALLASGFRSSLVLLAFAFLMSSYIRRGWIDVVQSLALAVPVVALLILLQGNFVQLPKPVQRSLSFLPGDWDYDAVRDAEGSTDWRVQMWKIMLTEERYIRSKWFGDGFGIDRRLMQSVEYLNSVNQQNDQEAAMLIGAVHSGPVSAIKFVGFVGWFLYSALTIAMAVYAFRIVRRAQTTPLFGTSMFLCIPVIYDPIGYNFVFGGFDSSFPNTLYYLGTLKLLNNALIDLDVPKTPAIRASAVNSVTPLKRLPAAASRF